MITMFAARIAGTLMAAAAIVLVLRLSETVAQAQSVAARQASSPTYVQQQEKINAWTVGVARPAWDRGCAFAPGRRDGPCRR